MITNTSGIRFASNLETITATLYNWTQEQLSDNALAWLDQTLEQVSEDASGRILFARFSVAPRKVGKADLNLNQAELENTSQLRQGWLPSGWSIDQAVRSLLLLTFPSDDKEQYLSAIGKLFAAADVAEQVALYQTLPLFPFPEAFKAQAIDGLRSHITAVFNAIALNNPYPADYFDEAAWNQMVLKALFVESQLSQIYGLEKRANATLARMLSDYAHERWAAGRVVNPQLWRPIGPFAAGALLQDLARVLESSASFEQAAAALALADATSSEAALLLDRVPQLKQQITSGHLTWRKFSTAHP